MISQASLIFFSDEDGKLVGGDAVKFFERSGLQRDLLAKVWSLSDNARRGYLDQRTFGKVTGLASATVCERNLSACLARWQSCFNCKCV